MIFYLYVLFEKALELAEHGRRDSYLRDAADIAELERRMRSFDKNDSDT
ncbi:DUF3563 family protein [Caballeronia sp. LZ065]|nr:DUF3563 family protein [Caballeronia sp. LZ065]MDR5780827.1 DUF3563 family protein [Caballeronia sp. LZ065]